MNKDITLEDLGYIKYEKHDDTGDYIEYYSDEECNTITFYRDSKSFCISEYCLYNARVLQAIYNKYKELGWLE